MKDAFLMGIVGILCLTVILIVAVLQGIDGMLIGSISGIIGTVVGYAFGHKQTKEEKKETNAEETTT